MHGARCRPPAIQNVFVINTDRCVNLQNTLCSLACRTLISVKRGRQIIIYRIVYNNIISDTFSRQYPCRIILFIHFVCLFACLSTNINITKSSRRPFGRIQKYRRPRSIKRIYIKEKMSENSRGVTR